VRAADGTVERVVETKAPGDATEDELAIREVNTGIFCFSGGPLLEALERVQPHNAQGEYYLPDVLTEMRAAGLSVAAMLADDPALTLGVNDRVDLAEVRAIAQYRILEAHMRAGVTIVDPARTLVDFGVTIGADTILEPSTFLRGSTQVGAGCRIGAMTTLIDARIGDGAAIVCSYLNDCEVEGGAQVGPFSYLRPGTIVRAGAKIGTFVEVKNSDIGERAKIPHLSYIGDADVGEQSNLGAGTITANYDGFAKHRTRVGKRTRIGVDTALVAPVEVGDDAWTAAGSVITQDIPPGALGVARERQRNVEGYGERKSPGLDDDSDDGASPNTPQRAGSSY
jgi:bifunctional UDP-N-acetylglucosamine pyrophosphorylase/glucosamine-1-phosphate N-acetyltransferase